MNNIYAGFKLVVIFIFLGVLFTLFSKMQPQAESFLTTASRLEVINAENQAKAVAAPTFIALMVRATEQAIGNEKVKAEAQANAQVVAAQGQADAARKGSDSLVLAVILAGCPVCGSGTVGVDAMRHRRNFIGLDLSMEYLVECAVKRTNEVQAMMLKV